MCNPHKHSAIIKAWADGAVIQVKSDDLGHGWVDVVNNNPIWSTKCDYRVKPEEKPDIVLKRPIILKTDVHGEHGISGRWETAKLKNNCKFTFDGETGKLKAVELI